MIHFDSVERGCGGVLLRRTDSVNSGFISIFHRSGKRRKENAQWIVLSRPKRWARADDVAILRVGDDQSRNTNTVLEGLPQICHLTPQIRRANTGFDKTSAKLRKKRNIECMNPTESISSL